MRKLYNATQEDYLLCKLLGVFLCTEASGTIALLTEG
jgi:hypothetical protein